MSESRGAAGRKEDSPGQKEELGQKEEPEQRCSRSTRTRVQSSQEAAWLEQRRSEEMMCAASSQG